MKFPLTFLGIYYGQLWETKLDNRGNLLEYYSIKSAEKLSNIFKPLNNKTRLVSFVKNNHLIMNSTLYCTYDSSRYVMSLDKIDTSYNGITHLNIEDFLLNKVDIKLS